MLLNNVEPEKWYSVTEGSRLLGWGGVDTVRDWINEGHMQALIKPGRTGKRPRIYRGAPEKADDE
jgi:hypothetical protein